MNREREPQLEKHAGDRIAPVAYRPPSAPGGAPKRGRRASPAAWSIVPLLLAIAVIAWFLLTARSVTVDVAPQPESVSIEGGPSLAYGGKHLLRPGSYVVVARRNGYRELHEALVVGDAPEQAFHYELARLPGRVTVAAKPDAEVTIDGTVRGTTPLRDLELAPGTHRLVIRAPRYQVYESDLKVEGGGVAQTITAELVPGWAPVTVTSVPAQADVSVDGAASGQTPATLELGAGAHELVVQRTGFKTWRQTIQVTANEPLKLAEIRLAGADARVRLTAEPAGASVAVDGSYRGAAPIELALTPGSEHKIDVSAPGYKPAQRTVRPDPSNGADLDVRLEPILGSVTFSLRPADATLLVDGKAQPAGTAQLELTAIPHKIEARKEGLLPYAGTVTPRPGFEQHVDIALSSAAEQKAARTPARITAKNGQVLVLVQPGSFRMGSERGTQGRQANETLRPVKLTRAFYLATTETTNAQFRQFDAGHSSGIVGHETLDNESQPAARVSWDDAARFCNWLSSKEGLTPAYQESNGSMALAQPVGNGYRLPTEAEWEWAARFAGRPEGLRYPWGPSLPPPPKSGNFADAKAGNLAPQLIADYDDGYPAASPVGSFAPSALGLFDLGGNVAEWANDRYDEGIAVDPPEAVDPLGPASGLEHSIRGSSWAQGRIVELRLAFRDHGHEGRMDVGFRIARYAE